MALRTGKVIIAKNIKLDKTYKNVIDYTEANMLTLVNTNKVAESSSCSFLKPGENVIDTSFSYSDCLKCNYLALQNPSYSNKWFFAFIDEVEYINNGTTRIHYTIDEFSTWFDYWQKQTCFVVREHVNDDTVGANTVPEMLETGEYICNSHLKADSMGQQVNTLSFIMASTCEPIAGEAKDTVAPTGKYNGIYTGLTYYRYDTTDAIDIILDLMAQNGKTNAINGIFLAPQWLCPYKQNGVYNEVANSSSPETFTLSIERQNTLNGYTPKNNKLLVSPYNYLIVSNNIGQNAILHYEKWSTQSITFIVRGVLNPGCSINIIPTNYNGCEYSDNDSITLGKFPICNFQNDMYTNWLTQNSINIFGMDINTDDLLFFGSMFNASTSLLSDIANKDVMGATSDISSGTIGSIQAMMSRKQHNMISPTVRGQLNAADVNVASGNNTFHFYKMSIKAEYAHIIDEYFTQKGYQINRVKIPNTTGRTYFNYVQIADKDCIAYSNLTNKSVPASSLEIINNIFRRGVTIWHNHANIGNYTLNNTIVS